MNLTPQALLLATRDTLIHPAAAARDVMGLRLNVSEGVMAVAVTAAGATLLTALMQLILGPVADAGMQDLFNRPFVLALSQFGVMMLGAFLMWRVGQAFGGKGTFAQGLALVAWLEVVLILLQLAEVLVLLILPVMALPAGIASLFAFFYLLTHFTAALNGYTSMVKTFFGILATSIIVLLLTSFALVFVIQVPHV